MNKIEYKYGDKFGNLTFIKDVKTNKHSKRIVKLQCYCGKYFDVDIQSVKRNYTKSCGCYQKQFMFNKAIKHGDGLKISKHYYIYSLWCGIKKRCFNKNEKAYRNYGGRGISMYPNWINNYHLFKEYILTNLGERPKGYSLDRINNDGNYEPDNLRWATRKQQANNRRNFKLNKLQVSIIRHSILFGEKGCYLAKIFKVSTSVISEIKNNKTHFLS